MKWFREIHKEALSALQNDNAGFDDKAVYEMRTELGKLTAEYAQLSVKFTDSYPKMKQLKSQIGGLERAA